MSALEARRVSLSEAVAYWTKLGFINFGGPAGQIAIMHEELVDRRKWISNERFLHALNFCMLLPGPEAQQLAIYTGWLLNGTIGGIAAGVLFVLPGFFFMLGLAWTYAVHGDVSWVAAIFYGLQSAVIAIVLAAVIRVGSRALRSLPLVAIAALAFVGIFFLQVPFPLIVVGAALSGLAGARSMPSVFLPPLSEEEGDEGSVVGNAPVDRPRGTPGRSLRVLATGLLIWWVPLAVVIGIRGVDDAIGRMGIFFSQAAMVTFGGAYAVLAYIDQAAVSQFGWLEPGQMVTGLGLAESTPGPLIMVTEFVGFLGAYRFPGGLDPVAAGVLGACVAVWATFAPCFLWIFLGAPYIEQLRGNRALAAALSAVTAAVVGVILNLAVTFAIYALFADVREAAVGPMNFPAPRLSSMDPAALLIAGAAFIGLWRWRSNVLWIVLGCAAAGLAYKAVI